LLLVRSGSYSPKVVVTIGVAGGGRVVVMVTTSKIVVGGTGSWAICPLNICSSGNKRAYVIIAVVTK